MLMAEAIFISHDSQMLAMLNDYICHKNFLNDSKDISLFLIIGHGPFSTLDGFIHELKAGIVAYCEHGLQSFSKCCPRDTHQGN